MAVRDPESEKCFSPPGFHAIIIIIFFASRTTNYISERGTTRSLVQNVSHENHKNHLMFIHELLREPLIVFSKVLEPDLPAPF